MTNIPLTRMIMNTLRILKGKNPGDNYYDEYLKHYAREGEDFYDQYHYAIERVISHQPKRILEIGVRTGLSICNMLSAYNDYSCIERIDLCDIWNDGYASPGIVKMNIDVMNIPVETKNKITYLIGESQTHIPKLEGPYDYILVDGDHNKDAAIKDLESVVPLCAPGGVIVFDDISPHGCDLVDVWMSFKEKYYDLFDFGENFKGKGTAWAVKKEGA